MLMCIEILEFSILGQTWSLYLMERAEHQGDVFTVIRVATKGPAVFYTSWCFYQSVAITEP